MINSNPLGVSDFSSYFERQKRKERVISKNEDALWDPESGMPEKKIGEDTLRQKELLPA